MRDLTQNELESASGGNIFKAIGTFFKVFTAAFSANKARKEYAEWGQAASKALFEHNYPYSEDCNYTCWGPLCKDSINGNVCYSDEEWKEMEVVHL